MDCYSKTKRQQPHLIGHFENSSAGTDFDSANKYLAGVTPTSALQSAYRVNDSGAAYECSVHYPNDYKIRDLDHWLLNARARNRRYIADRAATMNPLENFKDFVVAKYRSIIFGSGADH